nr:conserved Plasmodium protein, unknown function [Plasmodium sp. DRC-Itaito]
MKRYWENPFEENQFEIFITNLVLVQRVLKEMNKLNFMKMILSVLFSLITKNEIQLFYLMNLNMLSRRIILEMVSNNKIIINSRHMKKSHIMMLCCMQKSNQFLPKKRCTSNKKLYTIKIIWMWSQFTEERKKIIKKNRYASTNEIIEYKGWSIKIFNPKNDNMKKINKNSLTNLYMLMFIILLHVIVKIIIKKTCCHDINLDIIQKVIKIFLNTKNETYLLKYYLSALISFVPFIKPAIKIYYDHRYVNLSLYTLNLEIAKVFNGLLNVILKWSQAFKDEHTHMTNQIVIQMYKQLSSFSHNRNPNLGHMFKSLEVILRYQKYLMI